MNKARLLSLTVSLSLMAYSLQGFGRGFGLLLGHPVTWFDGH